jgi:hypothetical protein
MIHKMASSEKKIQILFRMVGDMLEIMLKISEKLYDYVHNAIVGEYNSFIGEQVLSLKDIHNYIKSDF